MTVRAEEERRGPSSLAQVAGHMLEIGDGLLGDDEDLSDPLTETQALEIVRREYVSGSCAAFAVALHDVTGHPIVAINGGLHMVVRRPDGLVVDFMGAGTIEDVAARYGMRCPPTEEWTREEALSLTDDLSESPWGDVAVARWVVDHLSHR